MLALVQHLSVYIVMLALCRKALAMLVFECTQSQFIEGSGGPCLPGKFGSLGFLRSFLVQFRGKITCQLAVSGTYALL